MSNRCLTMLALGAAFTLSACGGSGGRGATLTRSLGQGGRSGTDLNVLGKGCVDLTSLTKQIAASDRGATLHSRDYDIGRVRPVRGDHSIAFESVRDKASKEELARRSFIGENAPVLVSAAKASDVLAQSPAKELLEVTSQDACRTVKFASGDEFAVTYGNARYLALKNVKTGELREYGRQGDSLTMTVFAPAAVDNCNGGKSTGDTERISTRLAWGKDRDSLSLTQTYAQRLGVAVSPSADKFRSVVSDLPKKIDAVKCGQ